MADDRVSRETAELIPLAPHTWYVRRVGWLLEQPKVQEKNYYWVKKFKV